MICGVVLAAGRSRRMGAPKPLLSWRGETFLARAVGALREGGCERVMAVVGMGPAAAAVAVEAARCGARLVTNPAPRSEQIDSLRIALELLPDEAEAVVVIPVDVPGVCPDTVRALIGAFREHAAPIVLPSYRGVHGHPVLFAAAVWPELRTDPLPDGARTVIHARPERVRPVPVDDPAVLHDVDTPADLGGLPDGYA